MTILQAQHGWSVTRLAAPGTLSRGTGEGQYALVLYSDPTL
jgi:hypothetical protein